MHQIRLIDAKKDLEKDSQTEFKKILSRLQKRVQGQVYATELVASALSSQTNDTNNHNFFVGPSGTGKTELAKAIASKRTLIRFDMNQFPNESDCFKLFGAPPGSVSSDDHSYLANALDPENKCPKTLSKNGIYAATISKVVILFDEFEKAHSKIRQSLLTLLDEGYVDLTYTKRDWLEPGKNLKIRYSLKQSIIIATSNLFQVNVLQAFQENQSINQITEHFKALNLISPMHEGFSPEFLNRISIVPFAPIPKGDIYQNLIKNKAELFLGKYKEKIKCKEIVIEGDEAFYQYLELKLYGNGTGLRNIDNFFKETLTKAIDTDRGTRKWGDISNKKLTLLIVENQLQIKLSTFVRGNYIETPLTPFIIN